MEGGPLRPLVPSFRNRLLHVPYCDAGPGHCASAQLAKDQGILARQVLKCVEGLARPLHASVPDALADDVQVQVLRDVLYLPAYPCLSLQRLQQLCNEV